MKLELRSRTLGVSPLAALAADRSAEWYEPRPDRDGWRERVAATAADFKGGEWLLALAPAIEARGAAAERLRRVAESGGVVVTTGQQPGLFGGPLYTWFKAMSALALAEELEARTGVPVATIFWAATDDSDFAEASVTTVSVPGGAEIIRLEPRIEDSQQPLSDVSLGDVSGQLAALTDACGSASNVAVLESVRAAYSPETTIGGAYVRLLRAFLEPLGVAVLDASHSAVRTACAPLLKAALSKGAELERALSDRGKAIKAAGHRAQVAHVAGRTLVFTNGGSGRQRVRVRDADAILARSQELSPNVLLRPVMERAILPTVAYVGGPAEIAYFAQVSAVATVLQARPPLIVPRWSGVIVEPHVRRALDRIGAEVDDFADPHAVETRVARDELPTGISEALESAKARVVGALSEVGDAQGSSEMLPPAVIEGAKRQVVHRLERLERRYLAATKRRGGESLAEVATARGALYPHGQPQERALNVVPFIARYGDELFAAVKAKAREHAGTL